MFSVVLARSYFLSPNKSSNIIKYYIYVMELSLSQLIFYYVPILNTNKLKSY